MIAAVLLLTATGGQAVHVSVRQKQALAVQITRKCGLSDGTLIVRSDGSLRLRPRQDEPYQPVNCALQQLQKSGLISELPKTFIGNERYDGKLN